MGGGGEKEKEGDKEEERSSKRNCKAENDCGVTEAHTELIICMSNPKYHKNHVLTNG